MWPARGRLTRLLPRRFGVRNTSTPQPLTEAGIAAWADDYTRRTGKWPAIKLGPVPLSPDDTWSANNNALRRGRRGLPGGSSLAQLLSKIRGVPHPSAQPPLAEGLILSWADEHKACTGRLPTQASGAVLAAPGETRTGVSSALKQGRGGLYGGDRLRRLLRRAGRS